MCVCVGVVCVFEYPGLHVITGDPGSLEVHPDPDPSTRGLSPYGARGVLTLT